ncbi:hypothetical protein B4135_2632 [Caldibacillus debilis]|uniref:Uncharacterized protein n=1 Tax=Caldibacillus debilis TaxID=301148 RepID=A0A150LV89_9BACI|nr:hypothetical protein B4135_2632 [Caldibacillus debilis]
MLLPLSIGQVASYWKRGFSFLRTSWAGLPQNAGPEDASVFRKRIRVLALRAAVFKCRARF